MARAVGFEGLLVNIGGLGADTQQAHRIIAGLSTRVLRGNWRPERLGARSLDYFLAPPEHARRLTPAQAWELVHRLRREREVADAEPAFVIPGHAPLPRHLGAARRAGVRSSGAAADLPQSDGNEWSLKLCRVPQAWAHSQQTPGAAAFGEGIVIGHPDTGYTAHPEIVDPQRLLIPESHDFLGGRPGALDPLGGSNPGHGTSTASVIMSDIGGAPPGTLPFVSGAAPKAKLVPLRVNDSVVHFSYANLCRALYRCVERGYHVVSMSLGGPFGSSTLHRAVQSAVDEGLVLLAAAGNHWPAVVYPAKFDEVIAVAACNALGAMWSGSSTGPEVDLTAPGESVWRALTGPGSNYRVERSSGTSYAAATAAGVCALWLAHHGYAALVQRYGKSRLAATFKELVMTRGVGPTAGWDTGRWGAGIIDAERTLKAGLAALAPAAAMRRIRAAGPGPAQNKFDRIADFFPGMDPARLRRSLCRLFGAGERALAGVLEEIGDELAFQIAVNPALRDALEAPAAGARAKRSPAAGADAALQGRVSRTFRKRIA